MRVSDGVDATVVDLVADPVPVIEPPERRVLDETTILVDTRHEIMVNKLCALLSRSEYRDLVDLEALLEAGENLETALRAAPHKDTAFSTVTLAWVLSEMPVRALGVATGADEQDISDRMSFRDALVATLVAAGRPASPSDP